MSKTEQKVSRTLIRHTRASVPKVTITKEPKINRSKSMPRKLTQKKVISEVDLTMPSANSSKTAVKTIEKLENRKFIKNRKTSETIEDKTLQEKITKQMNFPYDKPIYKDLIPLCTKPSVQQKFSRSYPQSQKDREPDLNDYFKTKVFPEYSYATQMSTKPAKVIREYDGFRLVRMTQNWKL